MRLDDIILDPELQPRTMSDTLSRACWPYMGLNYAELDAELERRQRAVDAEQATLDRLADLLDSYPEWALHRDAELRHVLGVGDAAPSSAPSKRPEVA